MACWFHCWKTQLILFDQLNNTILLMWKWMSLFLRKSRLLRCWGCLSLLNWIGTLTLPHRKIGALIRSINFLFPEVALYLYKSTTQPCIEYCYHVWSGAPSYYLKILDKLQKQIFRTVGPSLAASLEPLAHHWNAASLSLITLVDALLNWFNWFHFLIVEGGLLIILIDWMVFLSTFPDVIRMSMSTVFFLTKLESGVFCL